MDYTRYHIGETGNLLCDINGKDYLRSIVLPEEKFPPSPETIVLLMNEAYRQGRLDMQKSIRYSLGIKEN